MTGSDDAKIEQRMTDIDVLNRAIEVMGSTSSAMRWMLTPIAALEGATPRSLLRTQGGKRAVLAVLGRLEHGGV